MLPNMIGFSFIVSHYRVCQKMQLVLNVQVAGLSIQEDTDDIEEEDQRNKGEWLTFRPSPLTRTLS